MNKHLRALLLASAVLVVSTHAALANELDELMARAGEQYASASFADAEANYRRLLEYGVQHAAVHFNLGNALYRQGHFSEARLAWERAARLDPGATDVRENLALAVAALGLEEAPPGPERLLRSALGGLGLTVWLGLAVVLWVLVNLGLAAGLVSEARRAVGDRLALVAVVGLLVVAPIAGLRLHWLEAAEAIVLEPDLEALSGPSATEKVLVTLPLGSKVRVEAQGGTWLHVSVQEGWHGWVPAATVGRIDS